MIALYILCHISHFSDLQMTDQPKIIQPHGHACFPAWIEMNIFPVKSLIDPHEKN